MTKLMAGAGGWVELQARQLQIQIAFVWHQQARPPIGRARQRSPRGCGSEGVCSKGLRIGNEGRT